MKFAAARQSVRHGYNGSLIVTLTVNPALDRTLSVDRLAFEDRAYIESRHESAGGRGINAACVIHSFGGKPLTNFSRRCTRLNRRT